MYYIFYPQNDDSPNFRRFPKMATFKIPQGLPDFPGPVSSSGICPPWPKLWSIQLRNADLGGWRSGDHQRLIVYPICLQAFICFIMFYTSQVVQDFFHQQYCCDWDTSKRNVVLWYANVKKLVESQFHRDLGHVRVQLLTQTLLDSAFWHQKSDTTSHSVSRAMWRVFSEFAFQVEICRCQVGVGAFDLLDSFSRWENSMSLDGPQVVER